MNTMPMYCTVVFNNFNVIFIRFIFHIGDSVVQPVKNDIYMYTYIYIYIHTHTHTHTYMNVPINMPINI